jgi:hypothetical protein
MQVSLIFEEKCFVRHLVRRFTILCDFARNESLNPEEAENGTDESYFALFFPQKEKEKGCEGCDDAIFLNI